MIYLIRTNSCADNRAEPRFARICAKIGTEFLKFCGMCAKKMRVKISTRLETGLF